jgi:hypothetical protein
VGDVIPLEPGGTGYTVAQIDPNRLLVLVFQGKEFVTTRVWMLHALDPAHTRLIVRWRALYRFTSSLTKETLTALTTSPLQTLGGLFIALFLGLAEFIMERKMMLGIKERAERTHVAGHSPMVE